MKDGRLPASGFQPTRTLLYDTSKTEEILGIKFRSYEDQVVEVTKQYLELIEVAGHEMTGHAKVRP